MSKKRIAALYIILFVMFSAIVVRLFFLTQNTGISDQAAAAHGNYKIKLTAQRGTIYDCNMQPLVNETNEYVAAVAPLKNPASELAALIPHVYDANSVLTRMQQGKPFTVKVDTPSINAQGIKVVNLKQRYDDNSIAPNIIGYLDSTGNGVSGIEKAFNDLLNKDAGTITANFAVDALGRTLQGVPCTVTQTGQGTDSGIVLTLDKNIQLFTQQVAQKYLKAGAAVVMDVKSGDIVACASVPTFSQNDLKAAVKADNSPMLNRAFAAYDVGSVFKIALAAEAIETGIDPSMTVDCTGKTVVAGKTFKCYKESGHGIQDMGQALSNSCNIYFITLGQLLGGDKILDMAKKLGFGKAINFVPGISSSAGVLPTSESLKIPAALANFSFGQGDFMATPIHVARMMCAVASGGLMPEPRLVKAEIDNNKKITKEYTNAQPVRVFSESTAAQLQQFLINTVDVGTGMPAKPEVGGAGGKTSTAQTGWLKDGKIINQAWFAGFYPAQNPKYVITVIAEDGTTGGGSAGPVFKEVADKLAPYCGLTTANAQ